MNHKTGSIPSSNQWIWIAHLGILGSMTAFDGPLYTGFHQFMQWAAESANPLLEELTKHRHWEFFKSFGNVWVAVIAWLYIWNQNRDKRKYLLPFLAAIALATLIYYVLQHGAGKVRPTVNDGVPFYFPPFTGWYIGKNLTFPSGHATFAFGLAAFLAFAHPKGRWLFYAAAALCGLSRVYFEAHYFSDVYAGALLGSGVMAYTLTRFEARRAEFADSEAEPAEVAASLPESTRRPAAAGSGGPMVSVVVPVKNEYENIIPLAREIDGALTGMADEYETIWIDDGSTDGSGSILERLERDNPRHRVIRLPRNLGQSAATWIGFRCCRAPVIVTLDGDGQNDPADIPRLIAPVLCGETDMVNGYRERRNDSIQRIIASRIANGFRNLTIGYTVRDVGCSIRAMRRECVRELPVFKGMHRFLPSLVASQGFIIAEIPVNHRPRRRGVTKYGIQNRLWVGLWDIVGVMWLKNRGLYHLTRDTAAEEDSGEIQPSRIKARAT